MTEQEQFTQILSLLNKLDSDVRETNTKLESTNKALEQLAKETKKEFDKPEGSV